MPHDLNSLRSLAKKFGQEHLFAFYDSLSSAGQAKLLAQIAQIDFDLVARLVDEFIEHPPPAAVLGRLEPAAVTALPRTAAEREAALAARAVGEAALRRGRVGCFLVAGGQGTRLGLSGPKGAYVIGPISQRTLFQLHAAKILALRRRYQAAIPWLIMTSDANDAQTRAFFAEHTYFGLGAESVRIFTQANLPAVGRDGKILLTDKDQVALSPNGHGGSLKALYDSGATRWLKDLGVDTLFYFQVDNVLTRIADPAFIGCHLQAGAQMSSKVCRKRDWKEGLGLLCRRDGKLGVIEYSDLPREIAQETDAGGRLKWWAGSIAIHVLDVDFVEALNHGGFQLPYHKAEKTVPCLGADGKPRALKPDEKNGIKFETFIFDALPQAQATANLETPREEDFSPVKNAEGQDSPATARRDLMERYARWLAAARTQVPRQPDGALDCRLEISPLTSLEGEDLAGQAPRVIAPGADVLL